VGFARGSEFRTPMESIGLLGSETPDIGERGALPYQDNRRSCVCGRKYKTAGHPRQAGTGRPALQSEGCHSNHSGQHTAHTTTKSSPPFP